MRYIQWFITFPLLLALLLFPSGLALSDIFTTLFFAWVVVVSGLVGALVVSTYKWGFFVFGVFALFYIWYVFHLCRRGHLLTPNVIARSVLLGPGPRSTFSAGPNVRTGYVRGSGFLAIITLLYPIAWGVSEGGNIISPNKEMIFYGVLDLVLGPLFLYYYLFGLREVDYETFGIHSGKYSDGPRVANAGSATTAASGTAGPSMLSAPQGNTAPVTHGSAGTGTAAPVAV